MRVTLGQVRRFISEALLLEYEQAIVRRGDKLYIVDDEGSTEYYGKAGQGQYAHLQDGETAEYMGSTFHVTDVRPSRRNSHRYRRF